MAKALVRWKRIKLLTQAYELIDQGITIKWLDLRVVTHRLSTEQQVKVIQHLVKRLCQKNLDRLANEISVETLLLWLAFTHKEVFLKAAVEQFFSEKNAADGCMKLVEIGLTSEITDSGHQTDAYAAAVMLICDIGKTIEQRTRAGEESFAEGPKLLPQITTYLLSVSNLNNYVIRLSLLHYFGYMATGGRNQAEFERVLNRFGYTVLDFLFQLLFKKKSESIALQFLLDNFPYILEATSSSQRIIHEIFKYYLLKRPDRCSLFLQTLGDKLDQTQASLRARRTFLQHLGALLQVVGKINHKPLVYDILSCIYRIHDPFLTELSIKIQNEPTLDEEQKEFARTLEMGTRAGQDPLNFLRTHKRGRHPSFHRSKQLEAFDQVALLGTLGAIGHSNGHAKAS